MSVYTPISEAQLESFLREYTIGQLVSFQGIEAGVENTNYFVTTDQGDYVLTLVESVGWDSVPFILNLVDHLASHGLPCAQPIHRNDDTLLGELAGKPAVIMNRLQGRPLERARALHCQIIGHTLGRFHQLSNQLPSEHRVELDQWCHDYGERVKAKLSTKDRRLLQDELQQLDAIAWKDLPVAPIHGDLFQDNALFDGDRLAGLIDFYHAFSGPFLYDLAVTLNAWCYDEEREQYDTDKALALLTAYQEVRPLSDVEGQHLLAMLRVAALRFWLSRLADKLFPRPGEVVTVKDPDGKKKLLLALRDGALAFLA